jgi:alkylation response protein AidB-like acyl-CoA dehydrogenase
MTTNRNDWPERAETVAREVLARHADDVDRRARWPAESIAALGDGGFFGLTVPGEFGGAGQGPRAFFAVMRALSGQCASSAMIYLMHVCATQVIAAAKEFPQRESILQDIVAGRHLSTLAFSEKGSRSHFWAPVSQAAAENNQIRLSAEKSFVTSAGHADSYVVSTRAAGATEPMVSTLYFVPRDAPGLTVSGPWNGLGLCGNASAPVRLAGVVVPASHRLSGEGEGLGAMMSLVLPWFQLGASAVALGVATAATEGLRNHLLASKLEHLGQSLADLPTLRARLAQMRIAVDTQQAFLQQVAAGMEDGQKDILLPLLESKAAAVESAVQVTDQAVRAGGGAAIGRHLSLERNFRDARALSVMAPTTDVLYDFIAKALLDMPLF